MVKRKRHSAELNANVMLEVLKGGRTLSELSARYNTPKSDHQMEESGL